MSSPEVAGPTNGHSSQYEVISSMAAVESGQSDIDLPDARHSSAARSSPADSDLPVQETPDYADERLAYSQSDISEERHASQDADYDMHEAVASQPDDDDDQSRESTPNSNRPSKRKALVSEDDYIKANPELYGLRRSVREVNHRGSSMRHLVSC